MSDEEPDVRKDLQAIQRECDRLYKVAENELISEREATAAAIFGHLWEIRRRLRSARAALNEREGKPSTCQEHGGDHDSRNAGSEVDTKKDCTCQTMEHPERPISTRVREDPDCPVHGTADAAPAPEGEGEELDEDLPHQEEVRREIMARDGRFQREYRKAGDEGRPLIHEGIRAGLMYAHLRAPSTEGDGD